MAIAPDGTWFATTSMDGTARIWNTDGISCATLTRHHGPVYGAAFAPDGNWLATVSHDRTIRIWARDGTNWSGATAIRIDGNASGCAWFPRTTDLCIAGEKGLYRFALQPPDT